ncbi:Importin-5, partial [Brachionus plicatilis]
VMLRRLISTSVDENWSGLNEQVCSTLKSELLSAVQQEADQSIRKKITDVIAELARFLIDESGSNKWPEVLQFLFELSSSSDANLKESALNIFTSFPGIFGNQEQHYMQVIHKLLFESLSDPNRAISHLAVKAITSFLKNHETEQATVMLFRDCLPLLLKNVQESAADNSDNEELQKCLIEVAEIAPKFLKSVLDQVFELCIHILVHNESTSRKHLALEVVVTLAENASGMVRKNAAKYIPLIVPQILAMMVDLDDDAEWSVQDEIEDEDEESNPITGESAMDRLACALGGKTMLPHILTNVNQMLANADWRYRYAGLMTLSSTAEGAHKQMEAYLDQMVDGIVAFLTDPHPRVRYAACNCLGQMATDFAPAFEKKYHAKVVPGLLMILDDEQNPRVQAHGGAALVNFAEDSPKTVLLTYLDKILDKLHQVLEKKVLELVNHKRKLVLEQIVTTIAAVADTVEDKFDVYYDKFMPKLKYLFQNATAADLRLLRGKTIECISLIGLAVGKHKFLHDCQDVMETLLKTQTNFDNLEDEDPQISYMISSWARMCKILGKDFEKYLPVVMAPVLKTASFKPEIAVVDEEEVKEISDEEDWQFVTIGDQQSFGIKTTGLEEKATACSMLVCYAKELKEGFAQYTEEVTKLMVPLFKFYFHDGVRTAAAESMPHLLECAKIRGEQYVCEMWNYICNDLIKAIDSEPEQEVLAELMRSFAKCVEFMSTRALNQDQVETVIKVLNKYLSEHFTKQQQRLEMRRDEDYDDETEDQLLDEDDFDALILSKISDVIHSLFKVYKSDFSMAFNQLVPHYDALMAPERPFTDRQWALCVWDDVIEFCGEASIGYQKHFLKRLIESLVDEAPEIRQAASYGCGVMAMHGGAQYAQACASAIPFLIQVINDRDSRSVENVQATENAISAVTKIMKYNNSAISVNQLLPTWFSWLPVYDDTEETPHTYGFLCDQVEANSEIVLGVNHCNIPRIIQVIVDCILREGIDMENIVAKRMTNICKHVQSNEPMMQACVSILSPDQKECLHKLLTMST